MKYIFDFDDVLFHTTRHRKEHMFVLLEKAGVSKDKIEEYYLHARESMFSLKNLLSHFSIKQDLYNEIMDESTNFINTELINVVKSLGKENCYLITYGDEGFQKDKIERGGMASLFSEIFITSGSKKDIVEQICAEHKSEKVIFVDDKVKYFEDLDLEKCPNLKTVLYTGQSKDELTASFL